MFSCGLSSRCLLVEVQILHSPFKSASVPRTPYAPSEVLMIKSTCSATKRPRGTNVNCDDPGKRRDSHMPAGRWSWIKTAGALALGNSLRAAPASAEVDSLIASKSLAVTETTAGKVRGFVRRGDVPSRDC